MRRRLISLPVLVAFLLLISKAPVNGQFASADPQYNPGAPGSLTAQQYPQAQQPYPQNPGTYPQAPGTYPQSNGYPQNGQPYGNQPMPPGENQQDLTADRQHGVARLSVADGEVNIQRGDGTGLVAAAINAPLVAQDHVQTAADGRAEIEFDYGNVARVAANTEVGFGDLEYRRYQLQLSAGSIVYRLLRNSGAQVEIDTPSIGIRPLQPGDYRVSVFADGSTQITVRGGAADVLSPRGSQSLGPGQSLLVRGNANDPEFQSVASPQYDQFDAWSQQRDQPYQSAQSYRYVSPDIAGAQDLDANGTWVSSQYGQAWEPTNVSADWSPYSDGNWAYEPYYGWTWVDAAPWGWAPYHYGRWFVNGGRWCWWPGGGRVGFGWAPATVGFFGIGGGVGWVPLAPYEYCPRWWGSGFGLSIGFRFGGGWGDRWHGGSIWNTYRNAGYRGGALMAGAGAFGVRGGRFAAVPRGQLNSAAFINGRLPVTPTRASYSFSNRPAFSNARFEVSTRAGNRTFFHAPQNGFAQRNGGYSSQRSGNSGFQAPRGQQSPARTPGGWQSFGDPGNAGRMNFAPSAEQNGGWHSFGESQHGVAPRSYAAPQPQQQQRYQSGYSQQRYNAPSYQQPRYNAPANQQPRYSAPSYQQPRYSAPQPNYRAPQYQQHYSAPSYQQPRSSAPSYQQHYSGGGGQHYSQPHYSAAPRGSSGGGSSHSGSGGGHSSGGGGHHR
ncbi:MAG TPA: DUF6600 domain-containing protein [Bryobacteraceae bacterium]|jgi:hypothetical protein|nr:DUF6600 domain-containing protein [Bryobacteraceae bacterium]